VWALGAPAAATAISCPPPLASSSPALRVPARLYLQLPRVGLRGRGYAPPAHAQHVQLSPWRLGGAEGAVPEHQSAALMSLIICSGGVGAGCVLGPGVASVGAATGVAASRGLWPVRPATSESHPAPSRPTCNITGLLRTVSARSSSSGSFSVCCTGSPAHACAFAVPEGPRRLLHLQNRPQLTAH
jgi:hypothetical protein